MNMYVHTHTHTLYALCNISVMHKCMHSNWIQYSFCLCPCVHNSFIESATKTVWHIEINDVMSSCDSLCCISPERFLHGVLWVFVHFTESLYWKELHRDNKSPQRSFILYFRTLWNQRREYFSLFFFTFFKMRTMTCNFLPLQRPDSFCPDPRFLLFIHFSRRCMSWILIRMIRSCWVQINGAWSLFHASESVLFFKWKYIFVRANFADSALDLFCWVTPHF